MADERVLPDDTVAPELWLQFTCDVCYRSDPFNVYASGVVQCGGTDVRPHPLRTMRPERLLEAADLPDPADVPKLVAVEHHYSSCNSEQHMGQPGAYAPCTCGGPYDAKGRKL